MVCSVIIRIFFKVCRKVELKGIYFVKNVKLCVWFFDNIHFT